VEVDPLWRLLKRQTAAVAQVVKSLRQSWQVAAGTMKVTLRTSLVDRRSWFPCQPHPYNRARSIVGPTRVAILNAPCGGAAGVKHARHSRNRTRQSALALPDNVAMRFLTAPLEHGNIIVSLRPSCLIDRNPARSRLSCRDDNETVVPDFKGLDHNGVSHW
jgi:hypothetical protein